MKKESIFTKEGFFGCDVFDLRFWKLRRSTLLWKVVFTAAEVTAAFFQKKFDLPVAERSRWIVLSSTFKKEVEDFFLTAARRNKSIFSCFQGRSAFATAKKNILHEFFFPDESKVKVVRRRL
jgi:hypothetical protein